jgi:hypothetical protein
VLSGRVESKADAAGAGGAKSMKRKGLAVRQAALIQTGGFIFLDAYL